MLVTVIASTADKNFNITIRDTRNSIRFVRMLNLVALSRYLNLALNDDFG